MKNLTAVESIFTSALTKATPEELAAYLNQACGPDAELRRHVERLLEADGQAGGFLNGSAPAATMDAPLAFEQPGTSIGPYKLLQEIGAGGMGTVYMAEQQEPVRRMVALKIIKPGMDSTQVIARFEAERQALALMDHPNIAKVLDAGTTESGRPYFVMELVKGIPITRFCDENQLTLRERLELFVPVCQAVQHAHQKGIIHRDLKPSNVLVALYDDRPVPKVIDFGVAKATSQKLTERTLFTAFGSFVGTLEYMSPEQAKLNALDIDTRSDVYALGVLLYELLTGNTPLEHERLKQTALDELLRTIREEEPPKPSTRLSRSGEALATISARRRTEPAKLGQVLRGELDWIAMKALEKDRTRRYETANGLARDVERYLKDEPVEACPPTAGYRLRKLARKHRAGLATAAGFAVLLLLGTVVSSWQALRATTAEAQANANANQAEEKAHEATAQRDEAQRQRDEVKALNEKLVAKEQQLQRTLYTSHINLAQHAWKEAALPWALELLEQHRPKAGESDLRGFEWHYLYRLCQEAPLLTLKGHISPSVKNVLFSPDGKRLVSSAGGGTVNSPTTGLRAVEPELKLWDAQTGQELRTIKGASPNVVFSPDGKRLATDVTTWDHTKSPPVAVDVKVKVWDAQTGEELLALKGHTGPITSVVFSPDGRRLASSDAKRLAAASAGPREEGKPGEVKVWDAQTGQELLSLQGGNNAVLSVAFSPDGKRLTSGITTWDDTKKAYVAGEVKVWDAQTGREIFTFKGLSGAVQSAAFSPDGKRLAGKSGDRRVGSTQVPEEVTVWDAQTGQELPSLQEHSDGSILFAFSPDGKRLATAGRRSQTPRIKVCDTETGRELFTFQRHTDEVTSLAFSPDGKRLASSSSDRTVRIWDLQTGQETQTLRMDVTRIHDVAFSPDGQRLACACWDGTVKVWDVQKDPETHIVHGDRVTFSPDFRRLATASSSENTVKVWNAQTGQELLTIKGGGNSVALSPDGKRVASAAGGVTKVWDAQTGQELLALNAGGWRVAFSPDSKYLAGAAFRDRTLRVWDAQTGRELFSLPKAIFNPLASIAFSPDGKRLASGGLGAKVWDAQTGQELLSLRVPSASVNSVAFSPDGQRLATGNTSGTVRVWDAQTGQELLTCKGRKTDYVLSVTFSPDGQRLASASQGHTVKVWDAQTGQELLSLQGGGGSVAFSPDGHRLVSAAGRTVKIYDATPLPEK